MFERVIYLYSNWLQFGTQWKPFLLVVLNERGNSTCVAKYNSQVSCLSLTGFAGLDKGALRRHSLSAYVYVMPSPLPNGQTLLYNHHDVARGSHSEVNQESCSGAHWWIAPFFKMRRNRLGLTKWLVKVKCNSSYTKNSSKIISHCQCFIWDRVNERYSSAKRLLRKRLNWDASIRACTK